MEQRKCPKCGFVDWPTTIVCKRCGFALDQQKTTISAEQVSRSDVKSAGWKKIKSGAIVTVLFVGGIIFLIVGDYHITSINLIAMATTLAPVGWLLAGVLEVVTGVPFLEMSRKWDGLAGWQRGVIGISVFLAGLVVLGIVCVVILVSLDAAQGIKR